MKITQTEIKLAMKKGMKTISELEEHKNGNHYRANNINYSGAYVRHSSKKESKRQI